MAAHGGGGSGAVRGEGELSSSALAMKAEELLGTSSPEATYGEEKVAGPMEIKGREEGLSTVLLIYTGGTLGMKPNSSGALEPVPEYLIERMREMHEFREAHMPAVDVLEMLPLIDSSDMGPHDWSRIAREVERRYYDYDGFVVAMGTDTMGHCACGLSFMLENLGKPVLLTGSMVPLAELYNDARRNLIVALLLAASLELPEVALFVNDKLLRGNRSIKVSSTGLDAFASPNYPPLATLGTSVRVEASLFCAQPKGRLRVHPEVSPDVLAVRLVPGFSDDAIIAMISNTPSLKGLVVELYGSGNVASRKSTFVQVMALAIRRGVVVVATSQCRTGRVDLEAYALGQRLARIGVVSGGDMTTECAAIKLGHLIARGYPPARINELITTPLRGELTKLTPTSRAKAPPGSKPVLPLIIHHKL